MKLPSEHAALDGTTPIRRKVVDPTRLDMVQ